MTMLLRLIVATFVLSILPTLESQAATIDSVQFTPTFFRVELVVFSRDGYVAPSDGEILETTVPRQFDSPLNAFGVPDEERKSIYRLISDEDLTPFSGQPPATELLSDRIAVPSTMPPPEPTPKQRVENAIADLEAQWLAESFQLRAANELLLTKQSQRLGRAGSTRVIWHGAWVQPVPDREHEAHQPVLVQLGDFTNDVWEVEGEIDVTRGRFLHFDTSLWFRSPTPGSYFELSESRRMRSTELNYLDHPKYGVLVRIDPLDLPPDLAAAVLALEKTR